jgi:hypothetical protein
MGQIGPFGLRIPRTGDKTEVDKLLRDLGFSTRVRENYKQAAAPFT